MIKTTAARRAVLTAVPLTVLALVTMSLALGADEKPKEGAGDGGKWTPLFDGKTLTGWHPIGQGEWKVQDGAIRGVNAAANDFGHLVSDRSFTDFTVRLKFKAVAGNSGFYFRIKEEGFSGVSDPWTPSQVWMTFAQKL